MHCGKELSVPLYCGCRFCPVCNRARLARIRSRIAFILDKARQDPTFQLKMITLTIRNQAAVSDGVRVLTKSFRRLRAKQAWKSRIRGGLYVIEVTGIPGHYHVHLHVLVDLRFFPVRLLSKIWSQVAPGKIVHIKRLPVHAALVYITKYLTKPSVTGSSVPIVEAGLKGARLFQPFGSWHGFSTKWKRPKSVCPSCKQPSLMPLDILYREAGIYRYAHSNQFQ